jgi:1,5-anhydro-D-fructose reductase (1,5-anhydro-D-mannitol-forming)
MTIRWGIIGCGAVCEVKSGPAFYKARGSSLEIVMRRDAEKAADFARRHGGVRFTTDAQAVIDDPRVDAVYIATPPGTHREYALKVARAKKPCYVEKPMARSEAECQEMVRAFERAERPLFVAYYRRALPRFLKVRELLASRRLGSLCVVSHNYQRAAEPQSDPAATRAHGDSGWREQAHHSGGGLFLDLASHVLDLFDFLLGPVVDVAGYAASHADPSADKEHSPGGPRVEDSVVLSVRFKSGVLGNGRYNFRASSSMDRLEFVGSRGSLALSVFGNEPLELRLGGHSEQIAVPQPEHVHQPLVQTIVDELSGLANARCPSRAESALRTNAVMDRVLSEYYGGRADAFWERPETWPGAKR